MAVTLTVKKVETAPIKIQVDLNTDAGRITGYITGHAKIRSKAENVAFGEKLTNGDFPDDISVLREMYASVDGLGDDSGPIEGEAVWDFLQNDRIGSYIVPGLIKAYFSQYNEARVGNFEKPRAR
ncbi:MAG: hypothetical protein ACYC7G_04620 [Rudaea sp.]